MGLRIYDEILVFVRAMRPIIDQIAKHDRDLAAQARSALSSVPLNTAEGSRQRGGKRRSRYEDAMGSADEVRAILQFAEAMQYIEPQPALIAEARRIAKTLCKLTR